MSMCVGGGKSGSEDTLAYCAANFAQVGMTQTLARELGQYSVNVNCVCPGWVDTSRLDHLKVGDWFDRMAMETPIGGTGLMKRWESSWPTCAPRRLPGYTASPSIWTGGGFMTH